MGLLNIVYSINCVTSYHGVAETPPPCTAAHPMTPPPQHPRPTQVGRGPPSRAAQTPPNKAGRPNGAPSTLVNLRIPVDLWAQLDRDLDRREGQTGLQANRGMMARRAFALFLETP
jgi:hypothetical protein